MVLQHEISHDLLHRPFLAAQFFNRIRGSRIGRVAGQPLSAGSQKLHGTAVVHRAGDTLASSKLGDAVLIEQAFQHDADILLGRKLIAGAWRGGCP